MKDQKRTITLEIKKIYELYFDCPLRDKDKSWATHFIYSAFPDGVRDLFNKMSTHFAIPMLWKKPKKYFNDHCLGKVNETSDDILGQLLITCVMSSRET